jgi:hypothetical protein
MRKRAVSEGEQLRYSSTDSCVAEERPASCLFATRSIRPPHHPSASSSLVLTASRERERATYDDLDIARHPTVPCTLSEGVYREERGAGGCSTMEEVRASRGERAAPEAVEGVAGAVEGSGERQQAARTEVGRRKGRKRRRGGGGQQPRPEWVFGGLAEFDTA